MKHKTWFRLVLKVVGIFLLADALPDLLNAAAATITNCMGLTPWRGTGFNLENLIGVAMEFGLLGTAIKSAIGIYFVVGGKALVGLVIPSNRPYCPECGHEISGVKGVHCPECGVRIPAELISPPEPAAPDEPVVIDASPRPALLRLVPRDNTKALVGYYLAIASLIPGLGLLIGPVAVAYGVEGLRYAKRRSHRSGVAHACTAVIVGCITTILNGCGLCLLPAFWSGYVSTY
jgi:hypothetical protein